MHTHKNSKLGGLALPFLLLALGCGVDSSGPTAVPRAHVAEEVSPGYLLISPLRDTNAYLIGGEGEVVKRWECENSPGNSVYLLDDGDLLRCVREGDNSVFHGGGEGGRLQRTSWDGEIEWDFLWSDETHLAHHDVAPMPNGNVLLISWSLKSREEALEAGMNPDLLQGEALWPDSIVEIEPIEPDGGEVVWEWHLWDHLVQDFDPAKANYGVVEEHPELVDLNAHRHREQKSEEEQRADLAHMAALGYAGDAAPTPNEAADEGEDASSTAQGGGKGPGGSGEDFCHTNGIDYNAELDQIVLSVRTFSELWVIDHSTTTAEAASHEGGRSGKGGDLLYRWGNPINYGRGVVDHRQLFAQHDVRWIPEGYPGAGNFLIFNNGDRDLRAYSTVVEVAPPIDGAGNYTLEDGDAFGPIEPVWQYVAEEPTEFFSSFISGAERQPNGNTLICSGEGGRVFEVNQAGELLWEFQNPFGSAESGGGPPGRSGGPGGRRGPRPDGRREPGPEGRPGEGPMGGPPTRGEGPPPRGEGPPPGEEGRRRGPEIDGPSGDERGGPQGADGSRGRGPRGGGRGGPSAKSLFRATRVAPDHPGLRGLME